MVSLVLISNLGIPFSCLSANAVHPKVLNLLTSGTLLCHLSYGEMEWGFALVGQEFSMMVAYLVASAQNLVGSPDWSSIHLAMLTIDLNFLSATPLCSGVSGALWVGTIP